MSTTMKAVHMSAQGGVDVLVTAEVPIPTPGPTDLLVNVKAVSINPVETKIRAGKWAGGSLPGGTILGLDFAGVVHAIGSDVPAGAFSVGEEVWLLGSTLPTKSNAEFALSDYRAVGKKPKSLNWEEAAAIPLVGLTVWEMLVEQMKVGSKPGALLIINGAGGCGSIASQLAKNHLGVKTVITTASRPESIAHTKALGADHVINHREPLKAQIDALKLSEPVEYIVIFSTTTTQLLSESFDIIAPRGTVGLAVQGPPENYGTLGAGQKKGVTLIWGFVFTKMILKWNLESQGQALNELARLADEGKLKSITTKVFDMNVQGLRDAHLLMEGGTTVGKAALRVPEIGAFQ